LTAAASQDGNGQYIDLWDYRIQNWERVWTGFATTFDSTRTVRLPGDVSRFIQAGTRAVRARLGWEELVSETAAAWTIRVDRARWRLTP